MKREQLIQNIEKLKHIMPSYVLEYYQSKLTIPYSLNTLYEYLKEYERFFSWLVDSGVADVDKINDSKSRLVKFSKTERETSVILSTS
ncbi:tyrosine recombinase XerS, partial [Lactococcus lactis]